MQAFGGASRQRPLSRLHNGNGSSMMSPAPAWATPARRADYSLASPGPVLPPGEPPCMPVQNASTERRLPPVGWLLKRVWRESHTPSWEALAALLAGAARVVRPLFCCPAYKILL